MRVLVAIFVSVFFGVACGDSDADQVDQLNIFSDIKKNVKKLDCKLYTFTGKKECEKHGCVWRKAFLGNKECFAK